MSNKRLCSVLATLLVAICLGSSAWGQGNWTTYHNSCSAAVLNGQSAVLTGIHYFIAEGHFMFVYEWCIAGNPPAYNLEISRQWPGDPSMPRVVTEMHQV